jgi:hypothetical protein
MYSALNARSQRLCHEVAVWIRLRHAHVLALHGTVSGFGPLPSLVSIWMHNGALNGYLERTSLTMEQKLKLVRFIVPNTSPYSIDTLVQLKQVVDGLIYRMGSPFRVHVFSLTTSPVHQEGVIHGDLTSVCNL